MRTTRRDLLKTGAAAAGWSLLPCGLAVAETDLGNGSVLQTVSDGIMRLPADTVYAGLDPDKLAAVLAERGADTKIAERACNVTLMRANERVVLFDVGAGPDFLQGLGQLETALAALSVSPDEVTDVIFTHAHPDHLWGLLDDFDELRFSNADYYLSQGEWDYWTDPATQGKMAPGYEHFATGAARRLEALKDRVQLFAGGAVLPGGAVAVEAFGHTPGHMAFQVGTDGTMIIADTVVEDVVSLARPDWPANMDVDKEAGIATRKKILDMAATDAFRIVGYHINRGGIGRIERLQDGYVFTPEV